MSNTKGRKYWIWRLAVVIIILAVLTKIYFRATDDFRLGNIKYDMPHHPEWEIAPLTEVAQNNLDDILKQKFSYVGKGSQSYAFVSDDQKHILKFFKFKHLRPSWVVTIIPNIPPLSDYLHKEDLRKQRKINHVFSGYKVAYEMHKEESGLLFVQLNPSNRSQVVTLIDKLGFQRSVDLGEVVYIVQEKGRTFRDVIGELIDKGDLAGVQDRISQIFNLYLSEYRKGIYDRDHGVMHNTGFVDDRPIHLDVGKMTIDENIKDQATYQKDMLLVVAKIKDWLNNNYPMQAKELSKGIDDSMVNIFGAPV